MSILPITQPTLVLDKDKCLSNLSRMVDKAKKAGVVLRPHFKTHQSLEVGRWFRENGVEKITCSSLSMASYFAEDGWNDITVAFPVNVLEVNKINDLASKIHLNILVESVESVETLSPQLTSEVEVFLKIDAGYGRTGIAYDNSERIRNIIHQLEESKLMHFRGFLAHAGNSYNARGRDEIADVHNATLQNLELLRSNFIDTYPELIISVGDTPTCSVMDDFGIADEIRPGCFVFHDLMQQQIGSCDYSEIAVAMACPVVALHPEKGEMVIYGGGVHFSKDRIAYNDIPVFGQVVASDENSWNAPLEGVYLKSLSQEHGILAAPESFIKESKVGDILLILPVHICMAADLMDHYVTTEGERIEKRTNSLS